MFEKIKFYIKMDCEIFTLVTLVLNLIYIISGSAESVNSEGYVKLTMEYLSVSTVITALFFVFEKVIRKTGASGHIISLLIVVCSVYGIGGGLYGWFPIASMWTLATFGVILIVYGAVYLLDFAGNIKASKYINEKLRKNREGNDE